jgi:hypothetical protein
LASAAAAAAAAHLGLAVRADLLAHPRRFLKGFSSIWPGCEVVTECLLEVRGLELPFDNPETETDIDMDMEVEAEVDIEARLPALSQSLDFLPLHLPAQVQSESSLFPLHAPTTR